MATTTILTNKGASIIQKAVADNAKCVITRVITSTHYENLPVELAAKSPFWWDGAEGTVTGLSLVNSSLDVKAHWNSNVTAQPIKSIGLMVKRVGDAKDYLLYAESYSNSAVQLDNAYDKIVSLPINAPVSAFTAIGNTMNAELNGEIAEIGGDMLGLGASIAYDGDNTLIQLKNSEGEVLSSIDASAFVIDGMVDSVAVVDGYLVITFNTAAGKSDISIPVTDFFDASQYYTKTETDTQISSAIKDATITIKKNSSDTTNPFSFTLNQASNAEMNIGLGGAAVKDVDTSIDAQSDANLPTSGAVKNYVSGQLPTVNNNTITIKKNSSDTTNPFSFTLNQSSNAELNIGLGGAAVKDVDTSIGSSASSNLPTTDAVKAYVDGFLNAVSYNSATNTLSFTSEDGQRTVNINLD